MPALTGRQLILRPAGDVSAGAWVPTDSSGQALSGVTNAAVQNDAIQAPTIPPLGNHSTATAPFSVPVQAELLMSLTGTLSPNEFASTVQAWVLASSNVAGQPLTLGLVDDTGQTLQSDNFAVPVAQTWFSATHTFSEDQFFIRDLAKLRLREFATVVGDTLSIHAAYVVLTTAYRNPVRCVI